MKKIFIAMALLLAVATASAQKIYFIYLQSENNAPFFVKIGDQVFNASAGGYVVLPQLVDSVYSFSIGKTGNADAEARFSIKIGAKDHGYLLKEADGKIALFDLQSLNLINPLQSQSRGGTSMQKRTDAFTVLLSQAANDPSLLEVYEKPAAAATEAGVAQAPGKQEAKQEETLQETPQPTEAKVPETQPAPATEAVADNTNATTDTNTTTSTAQQNELVNITQETAPSPATSQSENEVSGENHYKKSIVTRRSESSTSEGFGLVFLDETDGVVDTVRILIPNNSFVTNTPVKEVPAKHGDSKKFLDISTEAAPPQDTLSVEEANKKIASAEKKKACAAEASDKDFLKLRKQMATEDSDAAMISEAQKYFKRTCFATAQIKHLSALFLSPAGKYRFFDAAYNHVLDKEQYQTLQSELSDDYYIARFKELISKK